MNFTVVFLVIVLLGLSDCGNGSNLLEETVTESGIYVLNKDNFDEFIKLSTLILVEFYAPWCGHCKAFVPIYVQAAEELKANNLSIPLCKVDATVETELSNRYEISGYPSLKFFKDGVMYNYDGARTASAIVEFLKNVNSPDWKPPESKVLTLTEKNFTEIVEQSGYILVEFFAPWCGHCKSLAPEYAKAAKELQKQNPPILLATVDATQETELARKYDVNGYPTLKLFRNKKVVDYTGPRYSEGIVHWMLKNRENAAKHVHSLLQLKDLKNPQKVFLLGIFKNEDDILFSTFNDVANNVRDDLLSAYSFSDDVAKSYKADKNDGMGSVILLRPEYLTNIYEPDFVRYQHDKNSNITVDRLTSFIEQNMFPIVAEYNSETSQFLERFNKEFLCIFFFTVDFTVHHRKATRKWLEKITQVAVDYKNKIQFAISDDERQSDKLRELRLDDSGEEINAGCIKEKNIKYRMPAMEEFDSDHIREFIDNVLSDKLFPLLKSAPIPKLPLSNGIKTVVGDTYKSLVNDISNESVILLYRAPCAKCEASRNVLSKFSFKLSGKSLNFFAMDLSQNDLPPIDGLENVDSQPSIYLILNKVNLEPTTILRKHMVKYLGDHLNESEIQRFLIQNSQIIKDEL